MKLRNLLPFLLLALLAIAGTALALDADRAETSEPAEQPAVEQVETEALPDVLPELRPELTEANAACCIADCYEGFSQCTTYCGDTACMQACRQELQACKAGC